MPALAEAPRIEPARRLPPWLLAVAIALAGILAYSDSLHGPFVYDDVFAIVRNASIRNLWDLGKVLSPSGEPSTAQGRPVLALTFAINHAAGGENPLGYHLVNVAIHVLAGLALFGLSRRLLRLPPIPGPLAAEADRAGFALALLWTLHPLQTEAVTYLSQRAESLMALFYLFSAYAYLRCIQAPSSRLWPTLCVGACALGMATKEVMVSAPVILLLMDLAFSGDALPSIWRRRRGLLLALAATWIVLGCMVVATGGNRNGSVGLGAHAPWWGYFLTQGEAILRYLWLTVWPHPLVFDYGTFWGGFSARTAGACGLVLLLLLATACLWRRLPTVAFLGSWFFAILAPTSLLPGTTQMVVEHRMYLALAPVLALLVVAALRWLGSRAWVLLGAFAIVCGLLTYLRNLDYRTEYSLWAKTVAQRPGNAVAHYNLGHSIESDPAQRARAIAEFAAAIRLNPELADAHDSLGLLLQGDPASVPEAITQFRAAVKSAPNDPQARNNLGNLLLSTPAGLEEAIAQLEEAKRLAPQTPEIRTNLGRALAQVPSRSREAEAELKEALRLKPDADTWIDLGTLLASESGRDSESLDAFSNAVRLAPGNALARYNYGRVLGEDPSRADEAVAQLRESLRLDPSNARAHDSLGWVLSRTPGNERESMDQFREAVRLDPGDAGAHSNLATALANLPGGEPEAIRELKTALQIDPGLVEAWYNLGMLLANQPGRRTEAIQAFRTVLRLRPDLPQAADMLRQLGG